MIPRAARKREKYNEKLQESPQRGTDQERSLWAWFRRAHPETHKMISVGSKHAEATLEGRRCLDREHSDSVLRQHDKL